MGTYQLQMGLYPLYVVFFVKPQLPIYKVIYRGV